MWTVTAGRKFTILSRGFARQRFFFFNKQYFIFHIRWFYIVTLVSQGHSPVCDVLYCRWSSIINTFPAVFAAFNI